MRKAQRQKVDQALTLMAEGTAVVVRKDYGSEVETTTRSVPWQLGHGAWVVSLVGFSGGYDLSRVRVRQTSAVA